jgi:hypothetical protein
MRYTFCGRMQWYWGAEIRTFVILALAMYKLGTGFDDV